MKHKLFIYPLCLILAVSFLAGCKKNDEMKDLITLTNSSVAEKNPDISKPEGQFYETGDGQFKAEGGLVSLGKDSMRVMIEGKEYEFVLSPNAQREISIYNKDEKNLQIMRGTMLLITYTKKDLIWTAETMDILLAN